METLRDWVTMALSLFNTILLLWQGLTVLLNADKRTWGIWLAGGGLLLGGAFFVSHTAILGIGLTYQGPGMQFWWRVGLAPAIALPYSWYVVMLWYTGYWEDSTSALHRHHRPWFYLVSLDVVGGLFGLLLLATPLSDSPPLFLLKNWLLQLSVGSVPLLAIAFPVYIVQCIVLSLEALLRPGPSGRVMGDLARRRARPWLVATSLFLLFVGLLVGWIVLWAILVANLLATRQPTREQLSFIAWADFAITLLLTGSILSAGWAIISYEIFTGKSLPRRGLWHHWLRAILLASGYGVMVSSSLVLNLRPIYDLLLTAILITGFVAWMVWRSYTERERLMDSLRPFVTSQNLFSLMLTPETLTSSNTTAAPSFMALCQDVLGVTRAYLLAWGGMSVFIESPLTYPAGTSLPPAILPPTLAAQFTSPQTICKLLDPAGLAPFQWVVPLWSERGLIGLLFLGPKSAGGLFTQEEIEIARASGERLLDTQASSEIARRLLNLQRQRLAQSQVMDRQARRVLHDDILPLLHTAMLGLNGQATETMQLLGNAHKQISELLRQMPSGAAPELARLGLIRALQNTLDQDLGPAFDGVEWQVASKTQERLETISPLIAEVVFYAAREAIRNAARHGRGPDAGRPLQLRLLAHCHSQPTLVIEDNGVGLPAGTQRPAGHGLTLHATMMAVIGGSLSLESLPNQFTRVTLTWAE